MMTQNKYVAPVRTSWWTFPTWKGQGTQTLLYL
jgi:hypothetical protein